MIKNKLTVLLLVTAPFFSFAQKEISSKIKEVTVYLSGAEITRTARVNVEPGTNELKVTNLSPYINSKSVRVKVNNSKVVVVSASSRVNYWSDAKRRNQPEIKVIDDSIKQIKFKLALRSSREKVYKEEKSLLQANKSLGGANTGVDIEDLMDAADFYRERLINIETKLLDIAENKRELNEELNRLQRRRNHLYNGVRNMGEIIVKLSSEVRAGAKIEITYLANNASWTPFYDIRANSIDEPVELVYKAKVHQNTGEDWDNVKIKLSTGNPSVNNTQPRFSPWYLNYYQAGNYPRRANASAKRRKAYAEAPPMLMEVEVAEEAEAPYEKSKSTADFTTVVQNTINTTFDIAIPYTIKSKKNSQELVEIQKYELPVEYKYFAMPRVDRQAFLLARITEWGDYNLMSGDANVYFENTFVGTSYLETNLATDTLEVSLGRDKSIVVTRDKIKDFCKNTSFGGNKKSTRGYSIKVRNNKKQAIEIEVIDQVPLSNTKEIEVSLLEKGGAQYDENTGKLIWKITVPANSTKELQFKYEVKYPKDKVLSGL